MSQGSRHEEVRQEQERHFSEAVMVCGCHNAAFEAARAALKELISGMHESPA